MCELDTEILKVKNRARNVLTLYAVELFNSLFNVALKCCLSVSLMFEVVFVALYYIIEHYGW